MKFLKSFFFAIILFFCCNTAVAQTGAKKYDAAKYFAYANKAELQIVDSNYKNAILFYDSAFTNLAAPLSQDMYNYSICAVLEKKYEAAYDAIKFLIERGCDSMLFFKNPGFHEFRNREQTRIRKNYPVFISNRSKYIDTKIIRDILEMNEVDQYYFRKRVNNLSNKPFIDSLQKNDDSLILKLKKYFTIFQYLHEGVIGVRLEDSKLSCYPVFNILVRHHYQDLKYDLTPVLKNALESGYLRPELYASWVDFEFGRTPGFGAELLINEINNSLYISKYSGIKSKIEENRKEIGLCTLEEQVKKTIFSRYIDKNGFLFFAPIIISAGNNESFNEVLRRFSTVIPKPGKR
jgi:hypothetical protein